MSQRNRSKLLIELLALVSFLVSMDRRSASEMRGERRHAVGADGRPDARTGRHRERSGGVGGLMFSMVGNLVILTLIGASSLRAGQWYRRRRPVGAGPA